MDFHFAVSCDEAAMVYGGASLYLIVSDSPGPDENDRDEFGVMGYLVMLNCVETTLRCEGFFNVFCC